MAEPSIGMIVHYVSYGTPGGEYLQACRPAIVTAVGAWVDAEIVERDMGLRTVHQRWDTSALALTVENPSGTFKDLRIPQHDGAASPEPTDLCWDQSYPGGTWHWPAARRGLNG